jgi:hypothetical protein
VCFVHHDVPQMPQVFGPFGVMWQDREVERVRIGEDNVGIAPHKRPIGVGDVSVVPTPRGSRSTRRYRYESLRCMTCVLTEQCRMELDEASTKIERARESEGDIDREIEIERLGESAYENMQEPE